MQVELANCLLQPCCILHAYAQARAAPGFAGTDEPLDPRLLWLEPGSATLDPKEPGASAALPWFQQHSSRRDFLARLLEQLLTAGQRLPGADDWRGHLCHALLAVEAAACEDESAGNPKGAPGGAPLQGFHFDRARGTAKRLLALRREDMDLWAAYAQLEVQAGHAKVRNTCKRFRDSPHCQTCSASDLRGSVVPSGLVPVSGMYTQLEQKLQKGF